MHILDKQRAVNKSGGGGGGGGGEGGEGRGGGGGKGDQASGQRTLEAVKRHPAII
jgi:hypothetical protein